MLTTKILTMLISYILFSEIYKGMLFDYNNVNFIAEPSLFK